MTWPSINGFEMNDMPVKALKNALLDQFRKEGKNEEQAVVLALNYLVAMGDRMAANDVRVRNMYLTRLRNVQQFVQSRQST